WNANVRYIYTLIEKDGIIYFTSSSATQKEWQDRTFTTYFQSYDEAAPAFHQGFKTKRSFATTYSDRWGNFRTVCLEKHSERGGSFYFACADYDVSYVRDLLADNMRRTFIVAAFFILLGLPFLYVSNRKQQRDTALLQREIDEKSQVQDQLQVLYEELDQRVRDRTRELEESVLKKQLEVQRREEIQKQLQASEQRLELSIQSAGIGLWDWNLISGHVDISLEWLAMLGYEQDDITPHIDSWRNLIDPQIRRDIEIALVDHIRGKSEIFRTEQRLRTKDGDYKWVLVVGKLVEWDENGRPLRLLGVHIDIDDEKRASTQLKEARDAAEAGNKAKSEFLAMMSHELRTPLNAIIGFTSRLLGTPLSEQQRQYLLRVSSSSQLLFGIIRDILDFSKIEAGKLHLEERTFSLLEPIKNLEALFSEPARQKNLQFNIVHEQSVPVHLLGDPLRLTQVLMNLISNAIKFTEQGSVTLKIEGESVDQDSVALVFRVIDTGIGISTEDSDRLFEAFSQADSSHSRRYGGAGLGLTIAKQLAELMGGSLSFQSEINRGTEFCFRVRMHCAVPDTIDPVESKLPQLKSLAGCRVLLVDDIEVNRELAHELLREFQVEVITAENGVEAVACAISLPLDLILMDIQMPMMDGLAATQQIRALGMGLPIIAMTANAMPGDKEKCLASGMNDYLAKPISFEALQAVLQRWLPETRAKPIESRVAAAPLGAESSDTLASLIDEKSALARLGNRTTLYAKLLKSFVDSQQGQKNVLRELITTGDYENGLLVAHSMKSSAASIGAEILSSQAAKIEKALREGAEIDLAELDGYENSLQNVIAAVAQLRTRYEAA
ncbi:MAG TPA: ATP-binding protein, partial [Pseudomonadales bacterium]|nr:ATP-binding protein [Pseudomonadales bacterium]